MERKYKDANLEYVFNLLKTSSCKDCGISDMRLLQFDHVSDGKTRNVMSLVSRNGLDTIKEEINKCEIVCCNCHQIRTLTRANSSRIKYYENN